MHTRRYASLACATTIRPLATIEFQGGREEMRREVENRISIYFRTIIYKSVRSQFIFQKPPEVE